MAIMTYKPAKLLQIRQLSYWHLLSKLLIIWAITACSDKSSHGPLIIESPDFHQVQEYTNSISITFNIYPPSSGNEAIYHCPFYWAEGTKLIPGNCPSIPTGVYAYQLEYREKSNNLLLAKAEGRVNIDKTQGAVIEPNLGFNFDENQDGKNNLDDFLCRMKPNTVPIAKAGPDLTVEVDDVVKLNGGNSSDTDCNHPELTYLWTLTRPTNSSASLSDNEAMEPSFTPDVAGNYEITLVVNDGEVDSVADTMIVTATTQVEANSDAVNSTPKNNPPIANAGDNQTSEVGQAFTLDGSGSYDPDPGDQINYLWSAPTDIVLSSSTTEAELTFTIPSQVKTGTEYRFSLVVNDGKGGVSAVDEVVVTVSNSTPVANAGPDQNGKVGDVINLDGGDSTDANGDELSYSWTLTDPDGKTVDLTSATSATPSFTPTVAGSYQASLVVNDGQDDSKISNITITVTTNQKPIANAGIDQKAQVGDNITLDGSNSSDADDDSLTYQWTPPSGLSLENASAVKPALTIPTNTVAGTLTFSLVVEDTKGEKSDPDTMQITIINSVPVANAGADQNAEVGDSIGLDASASSDPNGDDLSYSWTSHQGILLSDNKIAKPSFTIANGSKAGILNFSVTVNDGHGGTATDNVDVSVLNTAPKATAGGDRRISLGSVMTLDGQASTDVNEDSLTYQWKVLAAPTSSSAIISNSDQDKASFTPNVLGSYSIELQVSDGSVSAMDMLTVVVEQAIPKSEMVLIPAGNFQMGDESSPNGISQGSGDTDEVPVHTVTIASFEIGKYEVTFNEYDQYLVSRGIDVTTITGGEGHDNGWGRGNRPAINVSWNDIQGYLDWLNSQLGIAVDDPKRYRLPTEAEWEYAARARTITAYHTGDCIDTSQANYDGSFGSSYIKKDGTPVDCPKTDLFRNKTEPVGNFSMNDFGLYDMHGNVWEWIEDCLHESYTGAPNDGSAWTANCTDSRRILRGGSWDMKPMPLRSANRGKDSAINRRNFIGFRLAKSI